MQPAEIYFSVYTMSEALQNDISANEQRCKKDP